MAVQITHIRSNENRTQFERTRILFDFVRAAFASPRTACTDLSRRLRDGVSLNIYAQAITQTKRDAQSRVVSLLLDKNEEKPSTEAYRTLTDVQNSGGDLQVVDKVGVPDGI